MASDTPGRVSENNRRHITVDPQNAYTRRDAAREMNSEIDVPPGMLSALQDSGFVLSPHAVAPERLKCLVAAYNVVVASATGDDVRRGSTSTRVSDFVNRGGAFDDVYMSPALLRACHSVIGRPFKLSSFLSRSLRPGSAARNCTLTCVETPPTGRSSASF